MYLLFICGGTKWFWGGTIHINNRYINSYNFAVFFYSSITFTPCTYSQINRPFLQHYASHGDRLISFLMRQCWCTDAPCAISTRKKLQKIICKWKAYQIRYASPVVAGGTRALLYWRRSEYIFKGTQAWEIFWLRFWIFLNL